MKPYIKSLLATLVVFLSLATPVLAGPWEDGVAAYKRGDYATAAQFWRPLAEQGYDRAQYNLGVMYEHGKGETQDYMEALKWYRRAAEQGHAVAHNNLGVMYEHGKGVPQDYAEAVKWFRKAAEQGVPDAPHNLGLMYANGAGVPQDLTIATKWYLIAAGLGHPEAMAKLIKLQSMLTEEQITKSSELATEWLEKNKPKK